MKRWQLFAFLLVLVASNFTLEYGYAPIKLEGYDWTMKGFDSMAIVDGKMINIPCKGTITYYPTSDDTILVREPNESGFSTRPPIKPKRQISVKPRKKGLFKREEIFCIGGIIEAQRRKRQYSDKRYFGLGQVPIGIGAVLRGWDLTEEEFQDPHRLPVVDCRVMSPGCPRDCFHCFTDKQKCTLTLDVVKRIIDEAAAMGARGLDFLGEGEPTVDRNFFPIVEHCASRGVQPVVFSEAATHLRDPVFVRRLNACGASVVPKCDSLYNPKYQNWVVGDHTGRYFEERNDALALLIAEGFNAVRDDGTTRLGFDMVVNRRNMHEVEQTLRYSRDNNLWIVFSFFLPAGRSVQAFEWDITCSEEEKYQIREAIQRIDREEYGFDHGVCNNFATTPCVERMQIYGDGSVSPCPGNEERIGNVREAGLKELHMRILARFPQHDPFCWKGHCLYRPPIA